MANPSCYYIMHSFDVFVCVFSYLFHGSQETLAISFYLSFTFYSLPHFLPKTIALVYEYLCVCACHFISSTGGAK